MSSYAKHRMRENRNNQYRPEQLLFYKQLKATRPNHVLLMEYTIIYGNEQGVNMTAVVDVADVTRKEAFRLNGPIHNSSVQEEKDWEQKEYLQNIGWKVTDIDSQTITQ